jgi:hypothetical protein
MGSSSSSGSCSGAGDEEDDNDDIVCFASTTAPPSLLTSSSIFLSEDRKGAWTTDVIAVVLFSPTTACSARPELVYLEFAETQTGVFASTLECGVPLIGWCRFEPECRLIITSGGFRCWAHKYPALGPSNRWKRLFKEEVMLSPVCARTITSI